MPDRTITTAANISASVPVGVTGMHLLGMPLSDLAYIVAIVSGLFAVASYIVKIWRDIRIGKAAQNRNEKE